MEIIEAIKMVDQTVARDSQEALHSFLSFEFTDILDKFRAQYIIDLFDKTYDPMFEEECIVQQLAVQAVEEAVQQYGVEQIASVQNRNRFIQALKKYSVNYILN